MKIFFSTSMALFFNEEIHGTRMLSIDDPKWIRPKIKTPGDTVIVEGEPVKMPDIISDDMSESPPKVEVKNLNCTLPPDDDLVEISEDLFRAMLTGREQGKLVVAGEDGLPMLVDRPPFTKEDLERGATARRDSLLAIAAIRTAPLQYAVDLDEATAADAALLEKWKRYQVAVNRVPEQPDFPHVISWPTEPS